MLEIGVDEAGRGPLLGRVYAAAVCWNPNLVPTVRINDSKLLNSKELETAYTYIKQHAIAYGIAYATEEEIDTMNILQASILAMHRAIEQCELVPDMILVDGNYFKIYNDSAEGPISYTTVVNGDATYLSIAAASILAKHERDTYIENLVAEHPDLQTKYSILSNKGYGTKAHIAGIKTYGISEFHRKTFKPCKI